MKRRDFLCLRTDPAKRVAELSCERLHMHCQQFGAQRLLACAPRPPAAEDAWDDDGPDLLLTRTTAELIEELEHALWGVTRLRLSEIEWLACDLTREIVETLTTRFRRRGGQVDLPEGAATGPASIGV